MKRTNAYLHGMRVVLEVKVEIELPGWAAVRHIPLAVTESDAQLDQAQQVHITTQSLVLVVRM